MIPRYSHIIEAKEPVVGAVHAKLGANLADLDARERHVGALLAQLHDERVDAVALSLGVQLGHHDAIVGRVCHFKRGQNVVWLKSSSGWICFHHI